MGRDGGSGDDGSGEGGGGGGGCCRIPLLLEGVGVLLKTFTNGLYG